MDWVYGQAIGFLGNFFALMGNMGVELFELEWVSAIILFFSRLAWALSCGEPVYRCPRPALCFIRVAAGNLFRGTYRLRTKHR